MSLFFRRAEARVISDLPWDRGGSSVNSRSLEQQLALVPVFAAVRLISDSIATLPLQQFRRSGETRSPMPLSRILQAPSAYGTRVEWVQRGLVSALLRGNAFGLKTGYDPATSSYGAVEWLNPDDVRLSQDGTQWLYKGRAVPPEQMLHIPALVLPGKREGISPMQAARVAVESGLESQRFHRDWFRNKAIPGMVFTNTAATLSQTEAGRVKERLSATLRAGEPFVAGRDWKLDLLKLPADDAGFVAAAKLTATQVASIYGVPPEMIGGESAGSLTYSTVELNQIQFLTNTLRPWMTRFEAALSDLLPKPQFVRFNVDAMLRVDTKTRHEIHRLDREIGLVNVDEIRAKEDLQPLPDGKGQDYTPLAKVGATPAKEAR